MSIYEQEPQEESTSEQQPQGVSAAEEQPQGVPESNTLSSQSSSDDALPDYAAALITFLTKDPSARCAKVIFPLIMHGSFCWFSGFLFCPV